MTDSELREACERVANRWLGWLWDADNCWWIDEKKNLVYSPLKESASEFIQKHNIIKLASPWGMDLLLDVVEQAGWIVRLDSFPCEDGKNHRFCLEYGGINRGRGWPAVSARHENRYAALIYALDKAGEVLNAKR